MNKLILIVLLSGIGLCPALSQNSDILLGHDLYHYIDRIDIKGLTKVYIPTDFKPFSRELLTTIFSQVDETQFSPLESDWNNRMRLIADDSLAAKTSAKGLWNTFYLNGRDTYSYLSKNGDFSLYINPSLYIGGGFERLPQNPVTDDYQLLTANTRGLSIRGSLMGKIGFYTEVQDNVWLAPSYLYERFQKTQSIPGEVLIKQFKDKNGIDYFSSKAYITFSPIKQMRVKFGKDRAFWGNGFQSTFLNDFAPDYLMLSVQTQVWKLSYANLFTQMLDYIPNKRDDQGTYPRKYGVFHQLNFHLNPKVSLGIFESIIYNPILANGRRGFELQYLNPLIFYRSIEQSLGSPDNSLIGFTAKYNFLRQVQVYGQLLLDDYNISKRDEGTGYWGNKIGFQVGAKYIDAFNIPTLDLQAEYHRIRPYTYQHFSLASNYAHFDQSLGHAAGANLDDFRLFLRFHPKPAWNIFLDLQSIRQGIDRNNINYGGDINKSYLVRRFADFGNTIAQGNPYKINQLSARLSYQVGGTDIFVELEGRYRNENTTKKSASILGLVRVGLPNKQVKF